MKNILLAVCCIFLSACASTEKVWVRSLDDTIVDAAQQAKQAGATDLTLDLLVTLGYKEKAFAPISVVPVGGEKSEVAGSRLTVKIPDLQRWEPPAATAYPLGVYLLDPLTHHLQELSADHRLVRERARRTLPAASQ